MAALEQIQAHWSDSYAVMLVELLGSVPNWKTRGGVLAILEKNSGQDFGADIDRWYDWIWRRAPGTHPQYAQFKADFFARIDPRFREYFQGEPRTAIRLDEIRWGGVLRDGIPPLKNPKMIPAGEADYLQDSNIVFGVEINGDARAYPKRILAWHEMVKDVVGGQSVNGVYCTLCGAMILYRTTIKGVHYELGTSGFLYRSNKLMYDHTTKSLWSALTGSPVVGSLVGHGLELERLYVVTTTWGEWRRRHPKSTVLSLETGHRRDYGEGVAYNDYFATDKLMFTVPNPDARLKNKAEVLALRFSQFPDKPLAISADFLSANPVYHAKLGTISFIVLTDKSGANRVFETKGRQFLSWDRLETAIDSKGNAWSVGEAELTSGNGLVLKRLPAHRAFWFGWHAAYPNTDLVR